LTVEDRASAQNAPVSARAETKGSCPNNPLVVCGTNQNIGL
jgi:hypothetical protein